MTLEKNSGSNSEAKDPYLILGVEKGASFETIKKAKERCLEEVGDEPLARAKIESAYDSLLMSSLKDRQLGKISIEAVSASKREEIVNEEGGSFAGSLVTRLKKLGSSNVANKGTAFFDFSVASQQGLSIRLAIGVLFLLLLLVTPPGNSALILSWSTIALLTCFVRAGKGFFRSFGLSFLLLSVGIVFGVFVLNGADSFYEHIEFLSKDKIIALPAMILLLIGSIFLVEN